VPWIAILSKMERSLCFETAKMGTRNMDIQMPHKTISKIAYQLGFEYPL
jgi:hypothetical protein